MESCFPRGGVIPKKSSFSSSAPAAVTVGDRTKRIEFGPNVSRHSKKEKLNRKQREKKQIAKNSVNLNINNVAGGVGGSDTDSDDSDDDSVNGSGTSTQQFAKANLLTNRSISVGMKLMGVIISIDTTFLLVLLPGGLIGKVLVSRISNAYIDLLSTVMKNDADTLNVNDSTMDVPYKILTELYSIGQMVCVKLVENVSSTRGTQHHNNIMLSMLPNDLNDQFVHNQLKKHLYLWVSISSCEDHGYICETGIKNLRGFIPRTEVHADAAVGTNPGNANDEKFNVGYQICCKIVNVQLAKSASTVTLKPQSPDKMQLKKFLHINWLVPMVLVKFKINRILKNGLHGTIKFDSDAQSTNEKLIGIVNEHNLINIFDKPSQKEYEIGQILMARILYVMPITKIIYLTLNLNAGGRGIAYDDDDGTDKSEHRLKDGTIIENAIVLRHTSNGIMLKLNDHCKGIIAYKQLRYHHLNFDKDEILLKYYQNSVHRVRVLHYNIMDSFYMCSINKNVLEEQYYKLDDVNVGDFVKAKICRALDDKGYFITVGHILGYLQYSCIAAKYRKPNKIKINDMMTVRILKKTDNRVFVTNQREFMNKSYTIPFDRKDLKKNQQYYGRIVCEFPRAYVIDLAQDLCGLLFKKRNLKPTSSRHDDDDDDDDANLKLNIGDVKQFEIKQFGIGKSKEKFVLTLKNSTNQDQLKTEDKKIIELNDNNNDKKSIKEEKLEKNDKKKEEEKITKSLTLIDDAGTQTQKEKAKAKSIKNTNTNSSFLNVTDFHIEKLTKDGLYFTSLSNNIHNGYIPNKFISDYPDLWKAIKAAQQNCDIPLAQLIRCIAEGPVSTPVSDDDDCDEDSPAPPVLVKVRNELYCLNANAENFNAFSQLQIGQLICGNIENITNQFVEIGIVMLPDGDDSNTNTNTNNKAIKETQLKTITIKLHINNLLDRHILNNKHIRININLVYGQKLYLKIIGKNIHEKYLHFSGKLSDVWNYNLNVSATLLNNYFNEINKIENGIKQQQQQQQKKKKEQNATTTTTILSELAKYKIGDLIDVGDILITNWISETNKIWVKCYQNKIDGVITSGSHSFKPSDLNNDNWKTLKLTGPAIIIWIDYGRQQIYLTIRKNIVERFLRCPTINGNTNNNNNENETEKVDDKGNVRRQPIMKQLINARGLKCDILLAHSDFTITLPRKLITNQFVFIPRRLHLNDFDGTILRSDFIEGDIVNVTIIKTDGFHLIGIYDSVFKAITNVMEMNNKRENDDGAKIELGKHKTTNDSKDSKNEQLNVKRKKFNDTVDKDDEDEDSSMEVDNENVSEHYQDKPDSDDHQDSDDDDDDDDDESEGDDEDDEGEGGDEDSDADDGDSDNDEGDSDDGEDEDNEDEDDDDDEDEDDEDDKDDADDNEDDDDDDEDDDEDDEDDAEEDEPKHLTNSIGLDQQLDGAVDFLPKKADKKLLGVDNFWNINNKKSHEDISKSSSDEENDVDADADADANKMLLDKNLTAHSKSLLQNAKERFQEVRKKEYEIEKLEKQLLEPDALPTTADHFDRLLLDEPNNSIIWIKYMCFHLQYNELDKTRSIGQKALKTISYLCTDELLNIWVALLNLELRYGSGTDSFNVCLTNALQRNDPYRVYTACIRMYIDVGVVGDKQKTELNGLLDIVQKKFRSMAEMWSMVATAYFDVRLMDKGKQMLNKGLKSIPEKEHINLIIKFANLNHKYNELETAHALFEQVLIAYPKRVDCWSQYIDMYIKSNDIESARQTLDRATSQKIPMKKMRILFKKYVEFEERFGNAQKIEEIKLRAANLINKEMFNNNNNN